MEYDLEDVRDQALIALFHTAVDKFDIDPEELIGAAKAGLLGNDVPRIGDHGLLLAACGELDEFLETDNE